MNQKKRNTDLKSKTIQTSRVERQTWNGQINANIVMDLGKGVRSNTKINIHTVKNKNSKVHTLQMPETQCRPSRCARTRQTCQRPRLACKCADAAAAAAVGTQAVLARPDSWCRAPETKNETELNNSNTKNEDEYMIACDGDESHNHNYHVVKIQM